MKLKLEIKDFQIEKNYDFVTVGNGNTLGTDLIWHHSGTTSLSVIFSLGHAMWIVMTSDYSTSRTGFIFYVKSVSDVGRQKSSLLLPTLYLVF